MPTIKFNSDNITTDIILSATWKQTRMGISWITLSWRSQWVPVTFQKCSVDFLTYSVLRKTNFPGKCNATYSRWSNFRNAFRPQVRWLRSALFLYSLLSAYRLCKFVFFISKNRVARRRQLPLWLCLGWVEDTQAISVPFLWAFPKVLIMAPRKENDPDI